MLPTTGFFKDIECPYYDSSCDRPYCHFRHRKRSQERTEGQDASAQLSEIPTYKPTPKSQLANTKSHIPISYVPDLIIRADRNYRTPSYSYIEKPTYKPTPISELSKSNRTSTVSKDEKIINSDNNLPNSNNLNADTINEGNDRCSEQKHEDINFEELSTEFDMIDDIINDNTATENSDVTGKNRDKEKEHKQDRDRSSSKSHKISATKHDKSSNKRSSMKDTKDSSSNKSESKSKKSDRKSHKLDSDSHTHKDSHKSLKSKDKHDHKKEQKSNRDKELEDKKRDKDKSKKVEAKSKHDKHSCASTRSHNNKSKHRDKEKRKEKYKHKDDKHRDTDKRHKTILQPDKKINEINLKQPDSNKYQVNEDVSNEIADEVYSDVDSDDPNDPSLEEECYRIFNEYKPEPRENLYENQKPTDIVEEYVPTPKKRVAYDNADQGGSKITHTKVKAAPNAALVMTNRFKLARLAQANNEQQNLMAELTKSTTKRVGSLDEQRGSVKLQKTHTVSRISKSNHVNVPSTSIVDDIIEGKNSSNHNQYKPTKPRRIAPVQNVNSIQQAKARFEEIARRKGAAMLNKTPVQTSGKGTQRVAHIPDVSLADIPDVLQPENKKIPMNVRTRYLTMLADECTKLYLLKEDAFDRALNEEFRVLERCAAIVTYRNSAMLAVNRLRKERQEREVQGLGPITSDETNETNSDSQFKGQKFYQNTIGYILSEEELELHGYPREGPISGRAVISAQKQMPKVNLDDMQRLCCRCFKVYLVDEFGIPLYAEECLYHPLKKRTLRGERIYLCCKSTEDTGCVTSHTHVSETEEGDLEGFQTTMEPNTEDDVRSHAVYALDCEMCYTTKGLELTRVTIIDTECKTVYETLVKPLNPIIDYNTRFSGITGDQMNRTSTSILQVQANILHLCNSKTILIGHSLESDLKALKIVHSCVIDTAVMFPHRLGLPHKRALRVLASEYLRKIIQGDVSGHDSAEDALTCMELVHWKIKEDLKVRGIK